MTDPEFRRTRDETILADLYLRLSDGRKEDALAGRRAKLEAEAKRLCWTIRRVVIENDMTPNGNGQLRPASAYKRVKIIKDGEEQWRVDRPEFRGIVRALMDRQITGLLAEDLDRLARDPRDLEDLIDCAERKGAIIRSLSSGEIHLETGDGRAMARVVCAFSRKESEDKARRLTDSRERYAGQSYQGGRRPYGFEPDPATRLDRVGDAAKYHRRLTIVDAEAKVIEQAAADILERGISLKAIARDLREHHEPTVTGTAWSAKILHDVLAKPAIAGLALRDGELVEAPWPAILPRDRWEELRDKLTNPSRRTNLANANEPRWLLSGFATCGVCGGRTRVSGGRNRAAAYIGAECCHVRRNAASLDEYISAAIVEVLSRPDAADLLKPQPRPGIDAKRLRAEERRLAKVRREKRQLHTEGLITGTELAADLREIQARLNTIDVQLADSDQPDPLAEFRGRPADVVWAELSIARRRAVAQVLIESVVINRAGRRGQGFDPATVKVTWL